KYYFYPYTHPRSILPERLSHANGVKSGYYNNYTIFHRQLSTGAQQSNKQGPKTPYAVGILERKLPVSGLERGSGCHPERSEGSLRPASQTLRCAQGDSHSLERSTPADPRAKRAHPLPQNWYNI